ncbi:MAG TPA: hypothetical protein VM911_03245 [Pyrinomonadaceae bacterium]|nr:hypothetical protein [Pyrinomonadaceae bacterium]
MGEIERWSIERLNEGFGKTHDAHSSRSVTRARKHKERNALSVILRAVRYFSSRRKRHAPLVKAG